MTVAEQVRNCPVCGEDFTYRRAASTTGTFCSAACQREYNRVALYAPVIVPSETRAKRMAKMADAEMTAALRRIRRELDERAHIPGDRHWRVEQMATQRLNAWTVHQIAIYHGVGRDVVKEILGE